MRYRPILVKFALRSLASSDLALFRLLKSLDCISTSLRAFNAASDAVAGVAGVAGAAASDVLAGLAGAAASDAVAGVAGVAACDAVAGAGGPNTHGPLRSNNGSKALRRSET